MPTANTTKLPPMRVSMRQGPLFFHPYHVDPLPTRKFEPRWTKPPCLWSFPCTTTASTTALKKATSVCESSSCKAMVATGLCSSKAAQTTCVMRDMNRNALRRMRWCAEKGPKILRLPAPQHHRLKQAACTCLSARKCGDCPRIHVASTCMRMKHDFRNTVIATMPNAWALC